MERIAIFKEVGQSISEADRMYLDDMDQRILRAVTQEVKDEEEKKEAAKE